MYLSNDLLQYVLNLYLEYDKLHYLDHCFRFKFDRNIHIKVVETKKYHHTYNDLELIKETYIDNELRRREYFLSNSNKRTEENFRHAVKEGQQFYWYPNGNKYAEEKYINGRKEGTQLCWHRDGSDYYKENFVNGVKNGEQYYWDQKTGKCKIKDYIHGRKKLGSVA